MTDTNIQALSAVLAVMDSKAMIEIPRHYASWTDYSGPAALRNSKVWSTFFRYLWFILYSAT